MPRLLVCDDEPVLRALVRATLEGAGHVIEEVADGDEALARACSDPPDLIVLDMMMPGRTGLEVLAELRRDPVAGRTPVILLTARAQAEDRQAADAAGADRYLAKPFSPLQLTRLVSELLDGRS